MARVVVTAEPCLDELKAQSLANIAWAIVIVKRLDDKLLTALTGVAAWRVSELNVQDFANIWADLVPSTGRCRAM